MPALAKPFLALVARDLMNGEVTTIPRDMGMQAAARWLEQMHVSGAPVVDEQGRCVGVLSSHDFVACCAANRNRCSQHRAEAHRGPCTSRDGVGSEWQIVQVEESVEGCGARSHDARSGDGAAGDAHCPAGPDDGGRARSSSHHRG